MTLAATTLSRRIFLTMAAMAPVKAAFTHSSPAETARDVPPSGPSPEPTLEGKALADASVASAGHPLTKEDQAEVEKQLASYPSSNGTLRRFPIDNSVGPSSGFTPATSRRTP